MAADVTSVQAVYLLRAGNLEPSACSHPCLNTSLFIALRECATAHSLRTYESIPSFQLCDIFFNDACIQEFPVLFLKGLLQNKTAKYTPGAILANHCNKIGPKYRTNHATIMVLV